MSNAQNTQPALSPDSEQRLKLYVFPFLHQETIDIVTNVIAHEKEKSRQKGAEEQRRLILSDIEKWTEDFGWGSEALEIISMINRDEHFIDLTCTPPEATSQKDSQE